ncbi:hypothetical protein HanXRQr2_Chr12g0521601 [Helianthus annuus]|uniref:Uncharacterized protein n=1 Tax=Helianthus annuus TaxID=4232 RepID=A0A9K3HDC5_HELAN|nr:hypothetical protein HanXRQr2_Chr12g0521601 [Helianthus annuus]
MLFYKTTGFHRDGPEVGVRISNQQGEEGVRLFKFVKWEMKRLSLIHKKGSFPINNEKKKKKKRLRLSPINKKKELWFSSIGKRSKKPASSTYKKKRKKVRRFNGELKDMKKLSSNDEAFRLSWKTLSEIIDTIRSRKTPTPETYRQWDEYARSFYLKMCTCFGVDYQHLEATTPQLGFVDGVTPPLPEGMSLDEHLARTSVGFVLRTLSWADGEHFEPKKHMDVTGPIQIIQPATEEMSFDEYVHQVGNTVEIIPSLLILNGAFDFGFYSPGTGPERIPYHLYLLLKEAVHIMSNTTNDEKDLKMVEEKICFFMTYFHSHLPPGFRYKRRTAYYDVDSYHSTREPRYEVGGYTLYRFYSLLMWGWDPRTRLTPQCMVDIMNIIYSRKTPSFWGMSCNQISFYCKLCSCFRIEYDRLEGASEDAVCLMNMRRN